MQVTFRPTDYESDADCALLAKWNNDPAMRRVWTPFRKKDEVAPLETVASIREKQAKRTTPLLHDEVILLGDRVVGQITLAINPGHHLSQGAQVAWIAIGIGDSSDRGSGVGTAAMKRLIELSKNAGATHVEAGTFEFNTPMRSLLTKLGFKELFRLEGFTWADGKAWADVRYELALSY